MRTLLLLVVLGAGCGVDRNIESKVTIDQGVYGLLVAAELPAAHQDVVVYAAGDLGVFASATSDRDGVYQIDLPNGDYTLCTSACTSISTLPNTTVRYDWTSGPGGGQWVMQ